MLSEPEAPLGPPVFGGPRGSDVREGSIVGFGEIALHPNLCVVVNLIAPIPEAKG